MSSIQRLGSALVLRKPISTCISPWNRNWCRVVSTTTTTGCSSTQPAAQPIAGESYDQKNARLKRPMSPHLTIYKPQLTSMLSISHRGTGVAMSTLLSGFSIGMLALPATYPYYIGLLAQSHYGPAVIFTAKFLLAFPFLFHMFNGVRHLTWDAGYGFSLRALYKSGYGVVALALVTAVMAAAY